MGLSDLRQLAVIEDVAFDELQGSVVAVDTHNWLYRYLTIIVKFTDSEAYTTKDGIEVPNVIGVLQGVPKFLEHDLLPVFVFDGEVVDYKTEEMAARQEKREEAAEAAAAARERGDELQARRLEARAQELTDPILQSTREVLECLDVPVVDAPTEAEAQAAYMAQEERVDYVGTEDYDSLLFGAPFTLRQLTSSGSPECMELAATLAAHEITREKLVDVAILMGTDYNDGVYGYGPKTALKAVKKHDDIFGVIEANDIEVPQAGELRELFLDPEVTDDYSISKTVEPDIEALWSCAVDEWGVDPVEIERAMERVRAATPARFS